MTDFREVDGKKSHHFTNIRQLWRSEFAQQKTDKEAECANYAQNQTIHFPHSRAPLGEKVECGAWTVGNTSGVHYLNCGHVRVTSRAL